RVVTGTQDLATDGHLGGISLIAAENANRVEGLKRKVAVPYQHVGDIKVDGLGMQIRRDKTDNLTSVGRLRPEILIAVEYIAEPHSVVVWLAPRPHNVTIHVDDALAIGQDGGNVHTIAIVHGKRCDCGAS